MGHKNRASIVETIASQDGLNLVYIRFPLKVVAEKYNTKIFQGFIAISDADTQRLTELLAEREIEATDIEFESKVRWLEEHEDYQDAIKKVKAYFTDFYVTNVRMKAAYPEDHDIFKPFNSA